MQNRIFSVDSAKAVKAQNFGYLNAIHYMAPAATAGVGNLCSHKSPFCESLCLGLTSGQAGMVKDIDSAAPQGNIVRQARVDKARRFMRDRAAYMRDVVRSLELVEKQARARGLKLCVRPNGSTDIAWEGVACERNGQTFRNIFEAFPRVQFVDYTKNPRRFWRPLPANYHLTLSRSELNERDCLDALSRGVNVAVIFAGDKPRYWNTYRVVDGDLHDLRHLDPRGTVTKRGVVIGLSPKGRKAKKDMSGFVVR